MDKNAIKKYAVWARRELISRVSQKALQYGISENEYADKNAESVNGKLLTAEEKHQRAALIDQINKNGYQQVMEEVAYTWFNRFCALRFMEVNGYLPTHVRVFSDEENNFKPQILAEAINLNLPGLKLDKVYELKNDNKDEELFKYLLIVQCNALNSILPGMFQKISDYTELLFPDNLLREGSAIQQMIELIPEEDWKDAVQIIGWLYQYYNSEPKDKVFDNLKKNIKISKDNIPAATQLFTPDWIVRYMVENSLGKLWMEGHPDSHIKENWKYYIEEAEQTAEVQAKLDSIHAEYAKIDPKNIKCIDPCMGSGHILVYMFDILVQIYGDFGYSTRDAVQYIVGNNLYGIDIDERAAQLSYFAVMMKARQYDRRFFERGIQPQVFAIQESNNLTKDAFEYIVGDDYILRTELQNVVDIFIDAKEYGSILKMPDINFNLLYARFYKMQDEVSLFTAEAIEHYLPLVKQAELLARKYEIVITNPPYMGSGGMNSILSDYIKSNYPNCKSDLFAVFMERGSTLAKDGFYLSMVTPETWIYISSFLTLRENIINQQCISTLCDLGLKAFDNGFGTAAWCFINKKISNYKATYVALTQYSTSEEKQKEFVNKNNYLYNSLDNYTSLPNTAFAYWCSQAMQRIFSTTKQLKEYYLFENGVKTGDDESFLRLWHEISYDYCSLAINSDSLNDNKKIWFRANKGGGYCKWYGAYYYVLKIGRNGFYIKSKVSKDIYRLRNKNNYSKSGICWPHIGTDKFSAKVLPQEIMSSTEPTIYSNNGVDYYLLGYLNSKVFNYMINMINPTVSYPMDSVANSHFVKSDDNYSVIELLAENNVALSKTDWDSFETSWDFKQHPFVRWASELWDATSIGATMSKYYGERKKVGSPMELCYLLWQGECNERFNTLKANEEELNRIFIDIYGLQDELTLEVEDKDVTVRKADLTRDVKSFISYAVGCMFGRYSLNVEGLAYAGGEWNSDKYSTYIPDADNIIPICDDEYFSDDIVGRFVKFVEVVYGKDTLEENLKFIADALGGKGLPRDVIRNYFLNEFYSDHTKIYQKRPIYWLFDSGKKNGFKALVYMHRYQPDTLARMRTDYVHEQQARYRTAIEGCNQSLLTANGSDRVKLSKKLQALTAQADEISKFEEKVHHLADMMISIDLDDGVKHNYEIFKDVLAPIK